MNRLKQLRLEFNLSVRDLSELLSIGKTALSYYETETRDFNTAVLRDISKFFNVSIDYLLCNSDNGIFVFYELDNKQYVINEECLNKYKADNLIYYKDYKRYIDINKILGIKHDTNISDLLKLINQQQRINKVFEGIETTKVNIPIDKVLTVEKMIQLDDSKFGIIKGMIDLM